MKRFCAAAALLFHLAIALEAEDAKIEKQTLLSAGRERVFYLYVPEQARASGPAPLLVLLHGSGRNGKVMVQKWEKLARQERIILAGPNSTDPQFWNLTNDGPGFLHDLVESLRASQPVDGRRIYLFGHSGGAVFALEIASLESEYFAAAANHAGSVELQNQVIFDYARRKIPLFLIVGTNDPLFSVYDVRATRDALRKRGFPVRTWEMGGHNHHYYGRAPEINKRVWGFLSQHVLPAEPRYQEYEAR